MVGVLGAPGGVQLLKRLSEGAGVLGSGSSGTFIYS